MLEYRNTKFIYHEWKAYNGNNVSGYKCNDKNLLKNVNTVSFGTRTLSEMHNKIDEYLDNTEFHKKQRQLTEAGITEYYASKRADGDSYTGD